MSHKFSVGQTVVFTPGQVEVLKTATAGKITRLLPVEGVEHQYHVQVEHGGPDRRARESQLRAVAVARPAAEPAG